MKSLTDDAELPLPARRCLSNDQAAEYLGIGITLLADLGIPFVKLGRRCVYDKVVDLDAWLEEYKRRGRARKEHSWPVSPDSIGDGTLVSGGSTLSYRTASDYAQALGLKTGKKPKPT